MRTRIAKRRRLDLHHPEFMAWVATLSCEICQRRPVEVAHIGLHGMGQKCADNESIPLCADHHRIGWCSIHAMGRRWWLHFNRERSALIAHYQARYEEETGRRLAA